MAQATLYTNTLTHIHTYKRISLIHPYTHTFTQTDRQTNKQTFYLYFSMIFMVKLEL